MGGRVGYCKTAMFGDLWMRYWCAFFGGEADVVLDLYLCCDVVIGWLDRFCGFWCVERLLGGLSFPGGG